MDSNKIDGQLWAKMLIAGNKYLEERKGMVDSLNVFPVPDGDTGTNMSLTMASAAKAVLQKPEDSVDQTCKHMAYGALMGARGNSGVILSQLLSGFAKRTEGIEELDYFILAECWESAVQAAYQAVMTPVEGTILTVAKEAALAAKVEALAPQASVLTVLEGAFKGAVLALAKTPSMLPVLKQAGVVDAGGQGFVYILEGMIKAYKGEEVSGSFSPDSIKISTGAAFEDTNELNLEFQYCTEFLVKKKNIDLSLDTIRNFLMDKGDCLLVVGSPEMAKIHIHTNYPGKVLDYCTDLGSLHEIKIHNMAEQSTEMQSKAQARKHLGIIATSLGAGLSEIFKSLGVDVIISGGQTMNPSTEDFVRAIENTLAEEIIILPNNKNVILAAQQAAKIANKPVEVVATKSIPQGIGALMAFNPEADLLTNKNKMAEAGEQILTLEVTYAVRDALFDGHEIEKGQILGLVDDKVVLTAATTEEAVFELLTQYIDKHHELVTIYYGEDISEEVAQDLVKRLALNNRDIDFELHFGGQPLYYYLISVE